MSTVTYLGFYCEGGGVGGTRGAVSSAVCGGGVPSYREGLMGKVLCPARADFFFKFLVQNGPFYVQKFLLRSLQTRRV